MNSLSCIEIDIDQVIKELFWFEDVVANGYQRQLCYSKTIVLSWLWLYKILWWDGNYNLHTHISYVLTENHREENQEIKRE
jgi:hypothetical protein